MASLRAKLYVALVHYPVINKNHEVISSAVTNLDLHDISRACRTYGVHRFYVVTLLDDQKVLVQRLVAHWTNGKGAQHNPLRREALDIIRVRDSLDQVRADIQKRDAQRPKTIVTSASDHHNGIRFDQLGALLRGTAPLVLVFGTAWGLARSCFDQADYILEPIRGVDGYNHLSVRSAASIILDRIQALK